MLWNPQYSTNKIYHNYSSSVHMQHTGIQAVSLWLMHEVTNLKLSTREWSQNQWCYRQVHIAITIIIYTCIILYVVHVAPHKYSIGRNTALMLATWLYILYMYYHYACSQHWTGWSSPTDRDTSSCVDHRPLAPTSWAGNSLLNTEIAEVILCSH